MVRMLADKVEFSVWFLVRSRGFQGLGKRIFFWKKELRVQVLILQINGGCIQKGMVVVYLFEFESLIRVQGIKDIFNLFVLGYFRFFQLVRFFGSFIVYVKFCFFYQFMWGFFIRVIVSLCCIFG